jgi:hypothetical protein
MGLFAILDMKIVLFYLIQLNWNGNEFPLIINDVNAALPLHFAAHMTIPLVRLRKITISNGSGMWKKERWNEIENSLRAIIKQDLD